MEILARGLRGNPRQIKRFLNILALRQRLAAANALGIRTEALIKLLVVEYAWRPFFRDLVETTDPTTGRSALLRIPAHRERLFRSNLNTESDGW